MKNFIAVLTISMLFAFSVPDVSAQDDCCGMGSIFSSLLQSGIFGGYGIQQYSAGGWNEIIQNTPGLVENFEDFGFAHGWMVGANVIQVRHEDLLVGIKFYFQSFTENQQATGTYEGEEATQEFDLKINNWNLGLSLSYILNNNFDLRIMDVYMTFPSSTLKNEISTASTSVRD